MNETYWNENLMGPGPTVAMIKDPRIDKQIMKATAPHSKPHPQDDKDREEFVAERIAWYMGLDDWGVANDAERDECLDLARTAIKAMRDYYTSKSES